MRTVKGPLGYQGSLYKQTKNLSSFLNKTGDHTNSTIK